MLRKLICRPDFFISFCLATLVALPTGAVTLDHAVSISYITGFSDVVDYYDDRPSMVSEIDPIPVGLAYTFTTNFNSGFRIDTGLGPVAIILGDVDYWDVPLRMTAGFTIIPSKPVRPYAKAGFSYHLADGDFMDDKPGFGLLGAVGLEIGKRGKISGFVEIAYDTAEATFEYYPGVSDRKIEAHGLVISGGVTF